MGVNKSCYLIARPDLESNPRPLVRKSDALIGTPPSHPTELVSQWNGHPRWQPWNCEDPSELFLLSKWCGRSLSLYLTVLTATTRRYERFWISTRQSSWSASHHAHRQLAGTIASAATPSNVPENWWWWKHKTLALLGRLGHVRTWLTLYNRIIRMYRSMMSAALAFDSALKPKCLAWSYCAHDFCLVAQSLSPVVFWLQLLPWRDFLQRLSVNFLQKTVNHFSLPQQLNSTACRITLVYYPYG